MAGCTTTSARGGKMGSRCSERIWMPAVGPDRENGKDGCGSRDLLGDARGHFIVVYSGKEILMGCLSRGPERQL